MNLVKDDVLSNASIEVYNDVDTGKVYLSPIFDRTKAHLSPITEKVRNGKAYTSGGNIVYYSSGMGGVHIANSPDTNSDGQPCKIKWIGSIIAVMDDSSRKRATDVTFKDSTSKEKAGITSKLIQTVG